MSELPEAPKTAANLPEVAKSSDRHIYTDTVRLVAHFNFHLTFYFPSSYIIIVAIPDQSLLPFWQITHFRNLCQRREAHACRLALGQERNNRRVPQQSKKALLGRLL